MTDAVAYEPGVRPQLSFTLSNVGAVACTLNVGTSQQLYTITSGADPVWNSKDCQTGAADQIITLEPAASGAQPAKSSPLVWDRVRSSPSTCDQANRPPVTGQGASYHLAVSVGGVTSTQTRQFVLR